MKRPKAKAGASPGQCPRCGASLPAGCDECPACGQQHDTAHYALGLCYRDRQEREQAVHEFETFLALYFDRPYVRDWKADAEAYLAAAP
jgi:predicted amidophosphoribosyltransferase